MSWRGVGEGGGRGRTRGKWESQEKVRGKTREGGASMKEEGKEPAVHSDSGGPGAGLLGDGLGEILQGNRVGATLT